MQRSTQRLRRLLKRKKFMPMPSAYDPITARLIESAGFDVVYSGGFVTGGSSCITEPMLTMTEQIDIDLLADNTCFGCGLENPAGRRRPVNTSRSPCTDF